MLSRSEDALLCDLWETYSVRDWRALPVITTARLFLGLPDGSRCKRLLSGAKADTDTLLLAVIADRLSWLCWAQTEDGHKGRNRPGYILDSLLEREEPEGVVGFESGESFRSAWDAITKGE